MAAYATTAEGDGYFSTRLFGEAWKTATPEDKEKALEMATRAIDRLPLKGWKNEASQAPAFPRYPDVEIPEAVKEATFEEALALLERGNSQRRKLQAEGVTSMSLGGLSETYAPRAGKGLLSQEAKELLRPWLLGAVRIT